MLPALHAGAMTGIDCAVRRPLAATVGADRAIRLWNHADRWAACTANIGGVLSMLDHFDWWAAGRSVLHATVELRCIASLDERRQSMTM